MREGGNAIDAAVAADAVLCVVYPHMTSVAGDLTAIVWPTDATSPVGLIGAGRSGELATIEAVRSRGHAAMPARGVLTVTVPGTVEAWGRLLERFGTLGFGAVLEPAAALAQDGYLITPQLARALMAAGRVLFLGEDVTGKPPHAITERGVGRTFQNIRLFQNMTALENVLVGMHSRLKANLFASVLRTPGVRREEAGARER